MQLRPRLHKQGQSLESPRSPNNDCRGSALPGKQCEVERGQSREECVIKPCCSQCQHSPSFPFPSLHMDALGQPLEAFGAFGRQLFCSESHGEGFPVKTTEMS